MQLGPSTRSRYGCARLGARAGPGGDDDGGFGADTAEFAHQSGHRFRRRHHDGEIGRCGQLFHAAQDRMSGNLSALGVDQVNLAGKSTAQQIARHCAANGVRPRAGADRHHRARRQELVEIAGGHDCVPSPTFERKP